MVYVSATRYCEYEGKVSLIRAIIRRLNGPTNIILQPKYYLA